MITTPQHTLLYFYLLLLIHPATPNSFDPYQINGGIVSAVAGKNYILIASDTRLSEGYEILSRSHLNSRLWRCCSRGGKSEWDGSIPIPKSCDSIISFEVDTENGAFVASAGCAADCEALKRQLRMEISAHDDWMTTTTCGASTSSILNAENVAVLLGNVLYSRRGFPFYSFCVLAGLHRETKEGVVHVYDAIGSHERVAVASAGMGREMMQPILDRLFSVEGDRNTAGSLRRDASAIKVNEQRLGLGLVPPVKVCVECDCEEAVSLLVKGYRSVAEREISVGDDVVVCIVRMGLEDEHENKGKRKGGYMEIRRFSLKKH